MAGNRHDHEYAISWSGDFRVLGIFSLDFRFAKSSNIKKGSSMPDEISATSYRTMTQIASHAIKEAIIRGSYKPGFRLIPANLERELNLGRAAIREALRELQGQGLVVSVPNKGAVVAQAIDPREVQEVFEIRYDLEGRASELAAMNITDDEIENLERLNMEMAGCQRDPREFFVLNRKFHLDFYKASGWNFLCQIIGQIYDRVLVWRSINLIPSQSIPELVEGHRRLLQSARARDGMLARRVMVEHLRVGYESLIEWIAQRG
jgi:DNA-binding GntR family transcriptional regulator